MSDASNSEEWKKIAEAITEETDAGKVVELAQKLMDALDHAVPAKDQSAAD